MLDIYSLLCYYFGKINNICLQFQMKKNLTKKKAGKISLKYILRINQTTYQRSTRHLFSIKAHDYNLRNLKPSIITRTLHVSTCY